MSRKLGVFVFAAAFLSTAVTYLLRERRPEKAIPDRARSCGAL